MQKHVYQKIENEMELWLCRGSIPSIAIFMKYPARDKGPRRAKIGMLLLEYMLSRSLLVLQAPIITL